MLLYILLTLLSFSSCGKYDVENCFRYKSLIYNAPCVECRSGFELLRSQNVCRQCKDGLKEVNGKCVTDYSYKPPEKPQIRVPLATNFEVPSPLSSVPKEQTNYQQKKANQYFKSFDPYCAAIDSRGKCETCKNGYELDGNNFCQLETVDKRQDCQIYDQVEKKCLKCKDNYLPNSEGLCSLSKIYSFTPQVKVEEEKEDKKIPEFCIDFFQGICWACRKNYIYDRIANKCILIKAPGEQSSFGKSKRKSESVADFSSKEKFVSSFLEVQGNETSLNETNSTNSTNSTQEVELQDKQEQNEEIPEYKDLNCRQVSQDRRYCKECTHFYYFSKEKGVCEGVSLICKEYSRENGNCTDCYWGYKLKDGACQLRI